MFWEEIQRDNFTFLSVTCSIQTFAPEIRLTDDMMHAMGGRKVAWNYFCALCQAVFRSAQRHVRLITLMLEAVFVDQLHCRFLIPV